MPTLTPLRRTDRDAARAGLVALAPLVTGLVPLGLAVGASAARAGLPPLVGWAASPLLYGASGQLTLTHVLGDGGPLWMAAAVTVLVNAQMGLYGIAMRPYWLGRSRRWRALAGQLLVGPVFALAATHHRDEPDPERRAAFYMAAGGALWLIWLGATGLGYALGGSLASLALLTLPTPLVLLTMTVRAAVDRPTLVAAGTAAVVGVAGLGIPHGLGLVFAAFAGVTAGLLAEALVRRPLAGAPA